ncbi:MAG TPA: hypothetical protein VGH33_05360 [Isosphaeraceae bacterium]
MASLAQIEANRRNASKSTGPTSPDGKVSSSRNSTKHGLTAEASDGETTYPGFEARLAEWEASVRPQTTATRLALRRAVGATFRLEACRVAFDDAIARHRVRAEQAWDDDRFAEAAALVGRLSRKPEVIAHQLRTSAHGVALLIRLWERLAESLEAEGGEWDDSEIATACDLLGIPTILRSGRLPFDPDEPGGDVPEARRAFVREELESLNAKLVGPMASLDALDHDIAVRGSLAMLTPPVRLILRYEAAASRVFDRMYALAKSPSEADSEPALTRMSEPAESRPRVRAGTPEAPPIDAPPDDETADLERRKAMDYEGLLARASASVTGFAGVRVDGPAEPAPMAAVSSPAEADPTASRPESTSHLNRHRRRARAARARAAG